MRDITIVNVPFLSFLLVGRMKDVWEEFVKVNLKVNDVLGQKLLLWYGDQRWSRTRNRGANTGVRYQIWEISQPTNNG